MRKNTKKKLQLIHDWGELYLDSPYEPDKERIGRGVLAMLLDLANDGEIKGEGFYTLHYAKQF